MPHNRLPRIIKKKLHTKRQKELRNTTEGTSEWDQNRSTGGPTPWQVHQDDYDEEILCGWCHTRTWWAYLYFWSIYVPYIV